MSTAKETKFRVWKIGLRDNEILLKATQTKPQDLITYYVEMITLRWEMQTQPKELRIIWKAKITMPKDLRTLESAKSIELLGSLTSAKVSGILSVGNIILHGDSITFCKENRTESKGRKTT